MPWIGAAVFVGVIIYALRAKDPVQCLRPPTRKDYCAIGWVHGRKGINWDRMPQELKGG